MKTKAVLAVLSLSCLVGACAKNPVGPSELAAPAVGQPVSEAGTVHFMPKHAKIKSTLPLGAPYYGYVDDQGLTLLFDATVGSATVNNSGPNTVYVKPNSDTATTSDGPILPGGSKTYSTVAKLALICASGQTANISVSWVP